MMRNVGSSSSGGKGIAAVVGVGPKLGRSVARKFAHEGYTVAILARDLGLIPFSLFLFYFFFSFYPFVSTYTAIHTLTHLNKLADFHVYMRVFYVPTEISSLFIFHRRDKETCGSFYFQKELF